MEYLDGDKFIVMSKILLVMFGVFFVVIFFLIFLYLYMKWVLVEIFVSCYSGVLGLYLFWFVW